MKWVIRPACVVPSITAIAKDASLREQIIDPEYRYSVTSGGDGDAQIAQRRVSVLPESKQHRFYDSMNHCSNELTMSKETADETYQRLLLRYDENHPDDDGDENIDEKISRIVRELDEIEASKTLAIGRSLAFNVPLDVADANLLRLANEKLVNYTNQIRSMDRILNMPINYPVHG